jgi:hypothetical protein
VLRTRYDLYMPLVPIWKGPRTDQSCENSNSGSSGSADSILTSEDSALSLVVLDYWALEQLKKSLCP